MIRMSAPTSVSARDRTRVTVEYPDFRHRLVHVRPSDAAGFDWGRRDVDDTDLTLCILVDAIRVRDLAEIPARRFATEVVATLSGDHFRLHRSEVLAWVEWADPAAQQITEARRERQVTA